MAEYGLSLQGFCPITETTDEMSGETTETLGDGVMTGRIMTVQGQTSRERVELWAGDRVDEEVQGSHSGSVTLEYSRLTLPQRAVLLGLPYTAGDALVETIDTQPPPCRIAALTGLIDHKKQLFAVTAYYRVQFDAPDDDFATKQKQPQLKGKTMKGTATDNCEGMYRAYSEFDTREAALAYFKQVLNIKTAGA